MHIGSDARLKYMWGLPRVSHHARLGCNLENYRLTRSLSPDHVYDCALLKLNAALIYLSECGALLRSHLLQKLWRPTCDNIGNCMSILMFNLRRGSLGPHVMFLLVQFGASYGTASRLSCIAAYGSFYC